MSYSASAFCSAPRSPIAILGVPFDNVTKAEAVRLVEKMIASRRPHYLVTPNVDFLVQARRDVELRRILIEAHLVLCDGTPLVWASRLLGNPLPERVAGADVVPLLIQVAAQKGYRLFLLGATPESGRRAVARLQTQYPTLIIAGHYSPPFNHLLEMDHDEIKRRVQKAKADLLLVSFGCPKQEKWVAMHYRSLAVPVTAGVGATIDFLAGQVKRAPAWMQRSGTEWIFRLAQEPRRLCRRYITDLWGFGTSILPQWWRLRIRSPRTPAPGNAGRPSGRGSLAKVGDCCRISLPARLDFATVGDHATLHERMGAGGRDCVLEMRSIEFIDSTGVGFLIRLHKSLRAQGLRLILMAPSSAVRRALALMRLDDFFDIAPDEQSLTHQLQDAPDQPSVSAFLPGVPNPVLRWRGEVTAANADSVWDYTRTYIAEPVSGGEKIINLSEVRFIDSTGLGLMIRAKKLSLQRQKTLVFVGLQPPVRNVLRLSQVEDFLLEPRLPGWRSVLSSRH